jgi:hypothetical protein
MRALVEVAVDVAAEEVAVVAAAREDFSLASTRCG